MIWQSIKLRWAYRKLQKARHRRCDVECAVRRHSGEVNIIKERIKVYLRKTRSEDD